MQWEFSTNTKVRSSSTEIFALCMVEHERYLLFLATVTWKGNYCICLLPTSWPCKWTIKLKVACFGKLKSCYFPAWQCTSTYWKKNPKIIIKKISKMESASTSPILTWFSTFWFPSVPITRKFLGTFRNREEFIKSFSDSSEKKKIERIRFFERNIKM